MSAQWTIDAVSVGTAAGVPAEVIHLHDRSHTTLDVPMIMFVLRNGQDTVIVDTGGPLDPDRVEGLHGFAWHCPEDHHPANRLVQLGVDPSSVRAIVNTHLHWDHCANNDVAPEAPVYVQEAELRYAVHPCVGNRSTYEVLPTVTAPWVKDLARFVTVNGEFDLAPGIRLVPLPGHSPGSQGVVVDTAKGTFVLTGDCVDDYSNWGDETPDSARPSGGYTDLIAFYDSLARLKASGWTPIPSHEPKVVAQGRFG